MVIEIFFRQADRQRSTSCQACSHSVNLILQLFVFIDIIQHAKLLGSCSVNQVTGKHQLFSLQHTNSLRQEIQAAAVGNQTNLGKAFAKACLGRCIHQIAGQHQVNACTGSNAVDISNNRFRNSSQAFGNVAHLSDKVLFGSNALQAVQIAKITAGTKCLAVAGKYDSTHLSVGSSLGNGSMQTVNQRVIH